MKKYYINVFPAKNTLKQRLTVVVSTLLGIPYHLWVSEENLINTIAENNLPLN